MTLLVDAIYQAMRRRVFTNDVVMVVRVIRTEIKLFIYLFYYTSGTKSSTIIYNNYTKINTQNYK